MAYIPHGKVIVSINNAEGKGVFEDYKPTELIPLSGQTTLRTIESLTTDPAPRIQFSSTAGHADGVAIANGFKVLECELQPGDLSPFHSTPSIDYGVMLTGEVVLLLDSGEERVLEAGDIYIQRAAQHAWENRSSQPARFFTVVVAVSSTDA
ncbi:hypothetical protein EDB80DRAFT_687523 [Ilyonectria destructans]|nr:hypothetical protein EDB80DRAFT_687523 [Ilyonectria destructans]